MDCRLEREPFACVSQRRSKLIAVRWAVPHAAAVRVAFLTGHRRDARFLLSFSLMIRALRRTRLAPLAAAIALFATMPITISSLLHDGMDDPICNPAVVVHDAAAHRVGAATTAAPDSQHCVLCHALQSLRAVSNAVRFVVPPVDARLVNATSAAAIRPHTVSNRPARAPPIA
jgi:hypothetical protein